MLQLLLLSKLWKFLRIVLFISFLGKLQGSVLVDVVDTHSNGAPHEWKHI
jgi:hypothetical protein